MARTALGLLGSTLMLAVAACGEATPPRVQDPAPCGQMEVDREHAASAGAVVVCGSVVDPSGVAAVRVSTIHYLDTPLRSPSSGYQPLADETDDGRLVPDEHLSLASEVGADEIVRVRLVTGGPAGTDRKEHVRIECRAAPVAEPVPEPARFDGSSARLEVFAVRGTTCSIASGG